MLTILAKLFKYLIILAILIGLGAGVAYLLAGPSTDKDAMAARLGQYTGQKFVINGPISFKLGSETQLNISGLTMAGSADGKVPAVTIKDATIRYNFLSLLKNDLEIESVDLNGVAINFVSSNPQTTTANPSSPSNPPSAANQSMQTSNPVSSDDESMNSKHAMISTLNMTDVNITFQQPNNITWEIRNASITAQNVDVYHGAKPTAISLKGDLFNSASGASYNIDTSINADLMQQTLTLDPLTLVWLGTTIQGSSTISQLNTAPIVSGNITMAQTGLGGLLKQLDPYMANSDSAVNDSIQLQMAYNYDTSASVLDISSMTMQVDDGTLTGNIKIKYNAPYQAEFNFDSQNLNAQPVFMLIDALFPPLPSKDILPFDLLKQTTINGKFTGASLSNKGVIF